MRQADSKKGSASIFQVLPLYLSLLLCLALIMGSGDKRAFLQLTQPAAYANFLSEAEKGGVGCSCAGLKT